MKIGILTFHCAANFGAMLQAYGLQTVLKEMGHDVSIIDYRPAFLFQPYKIFERSPFSGGWKRFIHPRTLLYDYQTSYIKWRRKKSFERFEKQWFTPLEMSEVNRLDAVIVGSDQIWNPRITANGFDKTYFLPSPPFSRHQLKISYAASAGKTQFFIGEIDDQTVSLLKDFSAISVREKSLGSAVEKIIGCHTPVVADPVLLGGREIFNRFINADLIPSRPYILYFSLVHQREQYEDFKQIGCHYPDHKAITLFSQSVLANDSDVICTASIERFISLIAGADYIVTSSFHGSAFSILFGKQFISIGDSINNTERLQELLNELGIGERLLIENPTDDNIPEKGVKLLNQPIDYQGVYDKLSIWRSKSRDFLRNALSSKTD